MKPAPIPDDEHIRIAALRALNILDTPAEERFDRITRLAQMIFNVPVSLVSLIDADRQWFKSNQGLPISESARNISFCGHAILQSHTFVVEDASQDARFADNPSSPALPTSASTPASPSPPTTATTSALSASSPPSPATSLPPNRPSSAS